MACKRLWVRVPSSPRSFISFWHNMKLNEAGSSRPNWMQGVARTPLATYRPHVLAWYVYTREYAAGPQLLSLAPVAQLAEQGTLNPRVAGSSPVRSTKQGCKLAQSHWGSTPSGKQCGDSLLKINGDCLVRSQSLVLQLTFNL